MEQSQRVRICDIADELRLSTATVSNVIHGKTAKVSAETVKRVQALLEERRYIPSMAGILLAQNCSKIIGVFINDHEKYEGHTLDDGFVSSALNCLSTEIEEQGLFMMVKKAKHPEEVLRFASMWNMEGLVMMGFCDRDYMYLRNRMHIPFVVYDGSCMEPERIVSITLDNFGGGFQVGEYYRKCGHRRALCITDNETGVDRERIKGFKNGFCPDGGADKGGCGVQTMVVPWQKALRRKFYIEKLDSFRRVSAVFAVSDFYAAELMCFLQKNGFGIPKDIAVAGFDDVPMCETVFPALTTVRQDTAMRAKVAVEKLKELKELKENESCETSVQLPVSLVVRAST